MTRRAPLGRSEIRLQYAKYLIENFRNPTQPPTSLNLSEAKQILGILVGTAVSCLFPINVFVCTVYATFSHLPL